MESDLGRQPFISILAIWLQNENYTNYAYSPNSVTTKK